MKKKDVPTKVIYKYGLFEYLVKSGCKFLYSTRNRTNPDWQCYMFEHNDKLDQALENHPNERYTNGEKTSRF
ncbi:hypothetical protein [Bacillus toyonensis]|uniref:hypothetical protein n=1 Tax=Bacillus toyonensis TaxID=155322 RepID=UPI000BEC10D7|nr:hypothetical protein [Bacillus toyonensis]PED17650.1 hypothetical protein CON63_24695 [Bacillus toyonensis]